MRIIPLLVIFCHIFQASINRTKSLPPGWACTTTPKGTTATSPEGFRCHVDPPLDANTTNLLRSVAWSMEDELMTTPDWQIQNYLRLKGIRNR